MASPIAFLAGTWRGAGNGAFPTMEPFAYDEEVRFLDLGVAALVYQQHAWDRDDGSVLHLETGVWRAGPDGRLAVTVALPRVTEVSEGTVSAGRISLRTTSVERAAGGAALVAVRREYTVSENRIDYRIAMATADVPDLTHHLEGSLERAADEDAPALSRG